VVAEAPKPLDVVRRLLSRSRKVLEEAVGIFRTEPRAYLDRARERKLKELGITREEIEELIEERSAARKARDFAKSDEIRDALLARNIVLLDSPQGTDWKIRQL